ncbi:hypothetical protein PC129_g8270 [Phytophthora cactorum]|uniref:Uncharacterized protein n=1 Tax=Phytophthora cactorum TaxID=29920 RepID=A0A8T1I7V4_9STRA|nr:hypothetical protein Pcac1_g867 [Phytophthora cactorum]KAG2885247.1 hypothetical protein PC117_g25628 [Phytophthora cactorum]KAG2906695.1 hypothetical protein PC114_g11056 [Phytophthora cactorum]KAG2978308.1 hypothetical protein PC120_g25342 [Phytophthora cactorum]KAG3021079.1 hypothetical protein PC119_g9748 [Phytophthora cactorum]
MVTEPTPTGNPDNAATTTAAMIKHDGSASESWWCTISNI